MVPYKGSSESSTGIFLLCEAPSSPGPELHLLPGFLTCGCESRGDVTHAERIFFTLSDVFPSPGPFIFDKLAKYSQYKNSPLLVTLGQV